MGTSTGVEATGVDGHPDAVKAHNDRIVFLIGSHALEAVPPVWPPQSWVAQADSSSFFTLLEVLHDLVARPRSRWRHEYSEDFHYDHFDARAGQAVFRWRIRGLFNDHTASFRIAEDGEDVGFVVTTVTDPRHDLELVAAHDVSDAPSNRAGVEHAIALFRRRGATTEDKGSACKALAVVLENRRPLIRQRLHGKDEGALVQIANQCGIRHHNASQHTDYDQDDYLDWIF